MSKRKVSDDQLREIVRARLTKGLAFSLKAFEYERVQEATRKRLAEMSREEILKEYSYCCYGCK